MCRVTRADGWRALSAGLLRWMARRGACLALRQSGDWWRMKFRPRVPLSVLAAEQTMWTERDELAAMSA